MARRLARGCVRVVGFDPDERVRRSLGDDIVEALAAPRIVWMMVPAGDVTQRTVDELAALFAPGDLLVDGGNANYHDSQRRGLALR